MINKIISIFNFLGALILLLLCYLGGVLLYPIIYWFKDSTLSRDYPLWWWFDDEDGLYGAEYWRKAKNITKKNWWISYRWCGLRNPMWNAHTKIIPKSGLQVPLKAYGNLIHDGQQTNLMNSAVFHYVNDDGTWNGNVGDWMSERYSYLGWTFVWFEVKESLYLRFSFAKQLIGPLGLEIQIGTFHRHMFKIKLKWNKKIWEKRELIDLSRLQFENYTLVDVEKRSIISNPHKISKYIINY